MRRSVIVVGAGPAGLAVAVAARRRGLHATVLERRSRIAGSWAERYDGLHLHTPRVQSGQPTGRLPRRYGRFVARDDLVRHLEDYAAAHGIRPILGVEVTRIDRGVADDGWLVHTSDGVRHAGRVVFATGYNNEPVVPDWPGRDGFTGTLLHANAYRDPAPFVGQRVLVVGAGNTGAEIAAQCAAGGAREVLLAIRTPPHVIPRTVVGLPTTLLGIPNEHLPPWLTDPVTRVLVRVTIGDLRRYGMPVPDAGLVAHFRRTDTVPVIDVGLVAQLKAGRVTPVPAVLGFRGDEVEVAAGWGDDVGGPPQRIAVDTVIAATGYRTGLEPLVGHLGVLDDHGRPVVTGAREHPDAPGLHFVGLRNPLSGLLLAIRMDATRVARKLAARGSRRLPLRR